MTATGLTGGEVCTMSNLENKEPAHLPIHTQSLSHFCFVAISFYFFLSLYIYIYDCDLADNMHIYIYTFKLCQCLFLMEGQCSVPNAGAC